MPSHLRQVDAKNRGVRTVLQGIAFSVLAAIVMVLYPVFTDAHSWGDLHWSLLGFSLAQAAGMSVLSYLMRQVLDPSAVPTPLPPADPGEPDDNEGGYIRMSPGWMAVVAVVALLVVVVILT